MKRIEQIGKLTFATVVLSAAAACSTVPPQDTAYKPALPVAKEAPQRNNGAIYQAGYSKNMFEDDRARGVGDLITVL
ncbi:MAG: flagellar basal body L-ring protein FlgH, partial [Pseudomonadota bacterium]